MIVAETSPLELHLRRIGMLAKVARLWPQSEGDMPHCLAVAVVDSASAEVRRVIFVFDRQEKWAVPDHEAADKVWSAVEWLARSTGASVPQEGLDPEMAFADEVGGAGVFVEGEIEAAKASGEPDSHPMSPGELAVYNTVLQRFLRDARAGRR